MHKYVLVIVCALSLAFLFPNCGFIENGEEGGNKESPFIKGLTLNNYPKSDGSTSAAPLNAIIACKVLDIDYEWVWDEGRVREVKPTLNRNNSKKFLQRIKASQTHQSFINLIDKKADIILSARKMSSDEKAYADNAGITLTETPIALDAFIFIINEANQVESLTISQIQDIYTGKITDWRDIGENDWEVSDDLSIFEIKPYVRNANSGSQELMETLVMKDLEIMDLPENDWEMISSMAGALDAVSHFHNSICYSVYYYKEHIVRDNTTKTIAVEEIYPNRETIADKSYPYTAEVYAVIRSDLDTSSMAYKLYEWLQTEAGKQAITESGYVSY